MKVIGYILSMLGKSRFIELVNFAVFLSIFMQTDSWNLERILSLIIVCTYGFCAIFDDLDMMYGSINGGR